MILEDKVKQEQENKYEQKKEDQEKKKEQNSIQKYEGLTSLNDYYQNKKLTAPQFFTAIEKNKVKDIKEADIQRCLGELDEQDPEFLRTLNLLYRAVQIKSLPAKQCIKFVSQAYIQLLSKHYKIVVELKKPANDLFEEVFYGLKSGLTGKKIDKRSVNLLKAVGVLNSYSRNLDGVEVVGFLAQELISKKDSRRISAIAEVFFRPTNKMKAMTDMLQVAEPVFKKMHNALRGQEQRRRECESAQEIQNQLREELKIKEDEIECLKLELKSFKNDCLSLATKIEQQQAIMVHEERELKGRSRVFLGKKVIPLIETALEFVELEPPRKSIIIERLEMVRVEIRREIEWLRSSD